MQGQVMNAGTPVQRLSQRGGVEVFAMDLDLPPLAAALPQGWSYRDSPDWGVSRVFGYRQGDAAGIHPNSLLIAYSISGLEAMEFPSEIFADISAEMLLLGGTVNESTTAAEPLGDGLAARCSGTYTNNGSLLFLDYRYYVFHDPARSPVSWLIEVVDTCPLAMRDALMTSDYQQIREIWERDLDTLLVEGFEDPAGEGDEQPSSAQISAGASVSDQTRMGLPVTGSSGSEADVQDRGMQTRPEQNTGGAHSGTR